MEGMSGFTRGGVRNQQDLSVAIAPRSYAYSGPFEFRRTAWQPNPMRNTADSSR